MIFSFGKRKRSKKKVQRGRKPPAAILRACKKLKIRTTKKVGKKRVYKKVSVLKRLISKKKKTLKRKMKKKVKKVHHRRRRSHRRSARFGNNQMSLAQGAFYTDKKDFGFNQSVMQTPGILNQSASIVTSTNNINRPAGLGLPDSSIPVYGVCRPFFTECVPTQVGPRDLGFVGQSDGTMFAIGGPFDGYKTPVSTSSFGKRLKYRRYRRRA